jgi:hypothetical protein
LTRAARALLGCALSACACRALPDIAANVCGNAVLDDGEDCDGFARDGLECRAPGQPAQCHLDCSLKPDGTATVCPSGYGCDAEHACRKATGAFVAQSDRILGNAWSLTSGDFDGDGQDDVLSQEHAVTLGQAKIRAHYFDRNGVPSHTWISNEPLGTPTPFVLPGSARKSLAHVRFGGVGILTGEVDGSLISEPLPSYSVDHTQMRMTNVFDEPIRNSSALVVLANRQGKRGLYRQSRDAEVIALVEELPYGAEELAADPVVTHLFEDEARFPCRDVALAARDRQELSVYSMCEHAPDTGEVDWREKPLVVTLPLEPPARITRGLLAADLDGDHHLDLMVGTDAGAYAAYGDGARFGPLEPIALVQTSGGDASGGVPLGMPLAAGDLSGDGRADLILPGGIALADPASTPRSPSYVISWGQPAAPFDEAVVADLNRDDLIDAVAVSNHGVDITYYEGTGSPRINPFTIATDRPIAHLTVGDFDADLIDDLALVQLPATPTGDQEISIAFGNPAGAPSAPRTVARLREIEQISAFRSDPRASVSFLGVVYGQSADDGSDGSALALMIGNTNRNMPCIVELTSFSEDGSLASARGLAVTVGAFSKPGVTDLLVLASNDQQSLVGPYGLWLLPNIATRRANLVKLGWSFAADLLPIVDGDTTPKLAATLGAGDLDGDRIDELVLAAPDGTRTRCLVSRSRIDGSMRRESASPPVVLEEPCEDDTQMSVTDLDGDGARDVVILVGTPGGKRKLLALWGDGTGELDASQLAVLSPRDVAPSAFALLSRGDGDAKWIAYTTDDAVHLSRPHGGARGFEDAGAIAALDHGTGIVAADVDGDRVDDLVVADDGTIRVLHAELTQP